MNELGNMGGQFSIGQPTATMSGMEDLPPEVAAEVQQLVEYYGIQPEQALELIMTREQQEPSSTPQGQLGMSVPQLSPTDYNALAQQFGIDATTFNGDDPAYSDQYDIASVLSGAYGYES